MSRAYRLFVEVRIKKTARARGLSSEELESRLRDVLLEAEGGSPETMDCSCEEETKLTAELMTSLCGCESPDEAHDRLCKAIKARGALGKKARVRTSWWFEERDPDDRFEDDDFEGA